MAAEIRMENGKPSVFLDGRPVPPILYTLSDIPASGSGTAQAQRNIAAFGRAGVALVGADTDISLGWRRVSPFDPEALTEEIHGALDANPDAKIILRLHMNPPYWWLRDNPGECLVYRTPEGDAAGTDDGESDRLIRGDAEHRLRVSLASEKWIAAASEKLGAFCRSLKGTRAGEALIGIQPACGMFGEWHQWGTDVSAPMKAHFVRFLREKYGSAEALRRAWNDPDVTFETAEFRPETFRPGDDGIFRDPQRSRCVMDSQEAVQTTPPEAILQFCRIVKENLPGLLTGAFYGYYLGTGGREKPITGHLKVDLLYRARGTIDFLCGPFCYLENRNPRGVPMQRALLESHRLRGFLWLTEMDQHPAGTEEYAGGDPARFAETVSVLRRNTLQPLLAGMGFWYYDHRIVPSLLAPGSKNQTAASVYRKTGWWDAPQLMAEIANIQRTAETLCRRPYLPAADVLLVYSRNSHYCRAETEDCEYRVQEAVMRSGAVFDCIDSGEFGLAELSRYRCVIFVNAYSITPEERTGIRSRLAGKQTVWLYAEGYCDGNALSCENLSETVGIRIRRAADAGSLRTCAPLPEEEIGIPRGQFAPLFAADDREAAPLAFYDSGETAAAEKGSDLWLGLPLLTRKMMSVIFRRCGVHLYCESGDPVLADGNLVVINCPGGGKRVLTLRGGKQVRLDLPPFTTAAVDSETGVRIL